MRASELRALRWRSGDFAESLVHVERGFTDEGGEDLPKSYRVRSVPLMPQVARALAQLRARDHFTADDDLVFPSLIGGFFGYDAMYRRYKTTQKRAGLRPLRFHEYADVCVMPMSVRRGCSERFRWSMGRHNQSASRKARSVSAGR